MGATGGGTARLPVEFFIPRRLLCCLQTPALATSPEFVLGNSCFILLHRNTSPKMLKHFGCHATGAWTEIHLIEHVLISCCGQFIGFSPMSCCQSCWGSATAGCRHPVCLKKYAQTWDDASVQSTRVPPPSLWQNHCKQGKMELFFKKALLSVLKILYLYLFF